MLWWGHLLYNILSRSHRKYLSVPIPNTPYFFHFWFMINSYWNYMAQDKMYFLLLKKKANSPITEHLVIISIMGLSWKVYEVILRIIGKLRMPVLLYHIWFMLFHTQAVDLSILLLLSCGTKRIMYPNNFREPFYQEKSMGLKFIEYCCI